MDYQEILDKLPGYELLPQRELEELLRQAVEKLMKLEERIARLERKDSGN